MMSYLIHSKLHIIRWQFVLLICLLVFNFSCYSDETAYSNSQLFETYQKIKPRLENNPYGVPVYIESSDKENRMQGEIYGLLDTPFQYLLESLLVPKNWCDIAPLHLNIKACTYQVYNQTCLLTFYTGRKFYEPPEDTYQLSYTFSVLKKTPDYFQIELSANDGPMGTSQYRINMQGTPVNKTGSFIHFSYSYKYNAITSMGMNTYLSTLGRDKIGFTVQSTDKEGKPVYVMGKLGIIERNAVRYYLAIKSYLDNQHLPDDREFTARLQHWFDSTEKHHLQLHEVEKQDYLQDKEKERTDQKSLQEKIKNSTSDNVCETAD